MSHDDQASATAREALERASKAEIGAALNEQRLTAHEAQCAERYSGIMDGLKTLRGWLIGALSSAVIALLSLVGALGVLWVQAVTAVG